MSHKSTARLVDTLLKQHSAIVLLFHVLLILAALVCAWLLRFDFTLRQRNILFAVAPILLVCRLAAGAQFHLLHGNWRYTGVYDVGEIGKAIGAGSLTFFVIVRFLLHLKAFPLSVYVIESILAACLLAGVRLSFRLLAETANRLPPGRARKNIVIVGAGFAAQMIIRELQQASSPYWIVGCVDDDCSKIGRKLHGKLVLGAIEELPRIVSEYHIDEALVAVPSATGAQMRRFLHFCEAAGLKSSTVPALHDLITGKSKISEVHEINVDDLLSRQPVKLDLFTVRASFTGKVVLVTGAAGSIGSELCRQIIQYRPARLICLDQNENGLFFLEMELNASAHAARVIYYVADYGDSNRIRRIFSQNGIDVVFHAAAYKHVPMMERNPREALENNVFGLLRFMEVATTHQCHTFVLISSDKAVNPSSVMGSTKRIGELIVGSLPEVRMRCVSVRFGNVLGSQGSVIPVFQKQLAEKQRITVTHPEISRFFMTIREAVSLVLQAPALGNHGDVLVLDMGEPVRIVDLARTLIRLSGKNEKDVKIAFTGLRPGEKLYEELFYANEQVSDTTCEKIKRTSAAVMTWSELKSRLDMLHTTMYGVSDDEVRRQIQGIVREYFCPRWENVALSARGDAAAAMAAGD
ncbi:MAG: SDR family NAD(P)-dependent oxidoreductase [Terriglobales bacterium]